MYGFVGFIAGEFDSSTMVFPASFDIQFAIGNGVVNIVKRVIFMECNLHADIIYGFYPITVTNAICTGRYGIPFLWCGGAKK